MWKLGLRPRYSFSGNICLKFFAFCLCSAEPCGHQLWRLEVAALSLKTTLQRQNTEISKQIFPEKEYRGLSPNFHIHVSVSDLYIPTIGLPILLKEICRPILELYKSVTDT